jgi:hypothetical protein
MDEATAELLSRHLDGDLAEAGEKEFQEQLAADPELQAELASMEQLCNAVRVLAEQEEPPVELSALLEPLRRSSPPPISVRPFYRWLAAAAALILGVTVAVEVARQNPGPELPLTTGPQPLPTETGYFQLQPLPTKEDNGLLGAGDHLLANPPPETELEPPPPLEVLGPLEPEQPMPDLQAEEEQPQPSGRRDIPISGVESELSEESLDNSSSTLAEFNAGEAAPEKAKAITTEGVSLGTTRRLRSAAPETDARGEVGCTMSLIVGGTEVIITGCETGDGMTPGKHPVVVTFSRGKLVSVRSASRAHADSFTDAGSPSDLTRSLSAMIGLSASDAVADGEHNGTVWVR